MKEKQYRIIEPENNEYIISKRWGEPFIYGNIECPFPFKVGDIVPFSQLEKWVEQGLHPVYFTEKVSKLEEILSNGEFIDNYNLKGFFIGEDNLNEEEEQLIKEIKENELNNER